MASRCDHSQVLPTEGKASRDPAHSHTLLTSVQRHPMLSFAGGILDFQLLLGSLRDPSPVLKTPFPTNTTVHCPAGICLNVPAHLRGAANGP